MREREEEIREVQDDMLYEEKSKMCTCMVIEVKSCSNWQSIWGGGGVAVSRDP